MNNLSDPQEGQGQFLPIHHFYNVNHLMMNRARLYQLGFGQYATPLIGWHNQHQGLSSYSHAYAAAPSKFVNAQKNSVTQQKTIQNSLCYAVPPPWLPPWSPGSNSSILASLWWWKKIQIRKDSLDWKLLWLFHWMIQIASFFAHFVVLNARHFLSCLSKNHSRILISVQNLEAKTNTNELARTQGEGAFAHPPPPPPKKKKLCEMFNFSMVSRDFWQR